MASFEDFQKIEIKIGKILEAEIVPDADRLLKFKVDMGNGEVRQIVSGVREHYPEPQSMVAKSVPVIVNLEPRMIKGVESQGMILYVVGEGENFCTLEPSKDIPPGTIVR